MRSGRNVSRHENISIPVTMAFGASCILIVNASPILVELSNHFIVTFQSKYTIIFAEIGDV
jgi:hypothetical protein